MSAPGREASEAGNSLGRKAEGSKCVNIHRAAAVIPGFSMFPRQADNHQPCSAEPGRQDLGLVYKLLGDWATHLPLWASVVSLVA